jgi:hypothetical protein
MSVLKSGRRKSSFARSVGLRNHPRLTIGETAFVKARAVDSAINHNITGLPSMKDRKLKFSIRKEWQDERPLGISSTMKAL